MTPVVARRHASAIFEGPRLGIKENEGEVFDIRSVPDSELMALPHSPPTP
jgi:hypothetical protein